MPLFRSLLFLLPLLVSISHAGAQQMTRQQQIDQAKALIQESCLSGNSYSFDASADGHIQIKSLRPNLRAGINLNAKTAPGGVGYVQEEIRKNVDESIRKCMEPYIGRILDLIIDVPGKSSSRDDMQRAISTIEGRAVTANFETQPNDLTSIVGRIEFDIFEDYLSETRGDRTYDVFGSNMKLGGDPDVVRQFGFLRGKLRGVRYASISTEQGPDARCSTPLIQIWDALKDEFGIVRGDISRLAIDMGNDDVLLRSIDDRAETANLIMTFRMNESTELLKKKNKNSTKQCSIAIAVEIK